MGPRYSADKFWFYVLGCSAAGLVACGGASGDDEWLAAEDIGQRQQAIVGGETDSEHTAVLAIATITPGEQGLCTGTLIAPNLVLTARHCVVPIESQLVSCSDSTFAAPYSPNNLWVTPSTSVSGSDLFPVREVGVPLDDGALCGADIALLILNGQFSDRLPPIAPRLDAPAARGELFTAIGFGSAQEEGSAGTRRGLDGLEVVCGPDDCRAPELLTNTEFVGEQAVCEGDSGGPAIDSGGQVVGVASRTGEDCGWAVYSAITPWRDWIVEVASRAASLGNYESPAWLTSAIAADADAALEGALPEAVAALPDGLDEALDELSEEAPARIPGLESDGLGEDPEAAPSFARGDSGCSVASAPSPGSSRGLALGALALSVLGLARRRRRSNA